VTEFNLSLRQLWQPNIASRLMGVIDQSRLDPAQIVVEVTESAAMKDPERALRTLRELSDTGLRLAIDDFGTGYSSLSRLTQLPTDFVKTAGALVRAGRAGAPARPMVGLPPQLGESLGRPAIAEGIEIDQQWRFRVGGGCSRGRGSLFGKP